MSKPNTQKSQIHSNIQNDLFSDLDCAHYKLFLDKFQAPIQPIHNLKVRLMLIKGFLLRNTNLKRTYQQRTYQQRNSEHTVYMHHSCMLIKIL